MKVKDEYGNTVGSVEDGFLHDYNIKNERGHRVATADKDFLSDDYTIRGTDGEKLGKVQKDLIGNGYTVRDKSGRKVATAKSSSLPDIGSAFSAGGLIAIAILGLVFYLGIKMIPELFNDLFNPFVEPESWLTTGPLLIFIILNILMIALKKDSFIAEHPIGYELLGATIGILIDAIIVAVIMIIDCSTKKNSYLLNTIFTVIITVIGVLPTLMVVFLPFGLIFGIIFAIKNRIK